ncbi:PREDICTED: putative protein FAR1-RELATED SEQUENCE 10 [Ipomoea nil]|uniref:putative protein FAR1-RELATED SEQUENCE 10 n=1 Tax=Ipomoea nil TaxID=35883 RepID=UPI000900BDC0|nr:PREDICTED: putative protein FAR1-RELATED SEQUENCE 10 [Ipomoea nil]
MKLGEVDSYHLDTSPGLTKCYVPLCEDSIKPFVGKVFPDLDIGVAFYNKYASIIGFDVRLGYMAKSNNEVVFGVLSRQFLKLNRKVGPGHMKFVADCGKVNIGPVQSFRLFGEMFGRLSNVGATSLEFWNIKRDIDSFSAGIGMMLFLGRILPFFGDVVSFDATYQTNRLLTKEDIESYVWLFEKFKEAMCSELRLLVTDQDPAMRVAFPRVFKEAKHRFCIWHIMYKVGDKVGPSLSKNETFMSKLNSVVWSHYLEPAEFDHQWNLFMEEFGLLEHSWFLKMYDLRHLWIPAYFSNVSMNGLIMTTSRSESENNLFGSFTTPQSNLVEFFMHFDRAIGSQRYSINKLNSDSEACFPDLKTPLSMEKHDAYVYTLTVFYLVQVEICAACFSCRVLNVREDQGVLYYDMKDGNDRVFSVVHKVAEVIASCGCKMFEMLTGGPKVHHWVGLLIGVVVDQCGGVDEKFVLLKNVWLDIQCCVSMVQSDMDRLQVFSQIIKEHKDMFLADKGGCSSAVDKRSIIELVCGSSVPSGVSILLPNKAKNKGSGRRIKGCKEIAIEQSKKERTCKSSNKPNHDSRNCPLRKMKDKVCNL